jgi:hypothetical protein
MASDDIPNTQIGRNNADFSIQLNRSIKELQHLVEVYHEHGHAGEAEEIYRTLVRLKVQRGDQFQGPESA